jgi:DNA-directed RNA polymerase specialized sigma24 family protein
MKKPSAEKPGSSLWPMTDWSGVGHAAKLVGKDADRLNQLILRYQKPLMIYLLSAFPSLASNADELLQNFAQDKILRQGWLGKASRERGRFRDFLKTSLRNFVHDHLRKNASAPASLDELGIDMPAEERSTELFDLDWARTILAEVLKRMEADCKGPGKDQPRRTCVWEVFRLRILQPALDDSEPSGYEEIVRQFGIVSPADAQNMLATAKRIFSRHLNEVIAEYEGGGQAARFELDEIKRALSCLSKKRKR